LTPAKSNPDYRVLVVLFVLFAALYSSTAFGGIDSFDGEMMFRVTESLVERQSLAIHDEIFHSNEPYAVYGLGTSVFAIPLYVVSRLVGTDSRWTMSLFNPIVTALTTAFVYLLARRLTFTPRVSLFLAMAFGVGSLAWPYTKTFFSEPLTTLLLVLAVFAGLEFRRRRRAGWLVLLGFSLGAGILTREDTLLVAPLVIAFSLWPRPSAADARSILFFLVPFALLGWVTWWYHDLRFQSLLSGYVAKTGNAFDWTPGTFITGLYGLVISSGKGLAFYTPLVVAAPLAWRRFWQVNPTVCALFSLLIGERFVVFSFLLRWWGGVCWGPRYVVPAIPFILLPIGFLLSPKDERSRLRRIALGALFAASILAQLPGVAVWYASYWNATINTKTIIPDQIFFSPRWTPLVGQFSWMLRSEHVQWFLPLPAASWSMLARAVLILIACVAFVILLWLHQSAEPTHLKTRSHL
jgi:hypothetical protein